MDLYVLVTVDIDNDGMSTQSERSSLSWSSLEAVPPLAAAIRALNLRATWFVRADNQIADVYGECAYLLREYGRLWSEFALAGDEIAWHPHVYRRRGRSYVPETDETRFANVLRETHANLLRENHTFASVRIGEGFCTNALMRCLSDLGMAVDSTAIPGRRRNDVERTFDWEPTPNRPYRPSASDYRVPGEPAIGTILEVPMSTSEFRADYDPRPLLRYVNPAYRCGVFEAGLDRYLDAVNAAHLCEVLCMVVHPDELQAHSESHGLYAYSPDEFRRNLEYVCAAVDARGWSLRPATALEIPKLISRMQA